jgi:flagellar M-ring protein FliF
MAEQPDLSKQTKQLAAFVKDLSPKQKLWLLGGAVVVASVLWGFVSALGKPEMKPLYTGLQPQDAQALAAQLATQKIPYEVSADGTSVSVAAEKLETARMQVAAQGAPKTGRMGFEIFDKPNWSASDYSEKVNYQRALEGELERTLQTLDGVETVRVHLVLPQESLFADDRSEAKASVVLKLRREAFSANSELAIRRLVAGAVERLRPENVTVIDSENQRPLSADSGHDGQTQADQALAKELVRTLEPIFGEGSVRASVHVEYDETSGDETQETFDPANPATLTLQKSEETLGGALAQGVPGTASNIPNTASPAKVSSSTDVQSSRSESGTYAVNKVVRHTLLPAGRVKRVTAALLVDDALTTDAKGTASRVKRTPEELKKIENVARAALGITDARGDVLAVESLPFREVKTEAAPPDTKMEKALRVTRQWSGYARYAVIALLFLAVYAMVLRPVRKQIVASLRQVAARPGSSTTLNGNTGQMLPPTDDHRDPLVKQTAQLKKQLVDKAKAEPASASQLVQNWLREEQA